MVLGIVGCLSGTIPWKLVRQVLPWTSSQTRRNFLKSNSELFKSPRETSNTRPLRKSEEISEQELSSTEAQNPQAPIKRTRSLGSVHEGLADVAVGEHRRCADVVPLLSGEGVDGLLLGTLLAHLLILSNSHAYKRSSELIRVETD